MNCEELKQALDAYMDGELAREEIRAIEDHVKTCSACRDELKVARLMKNMFADMDDEDDVPLEAQAAWRGAIRKEAAKKKKRNWTRGAYAAAAALVLALGIGFTQNGMNDRTQMVLPEENVQTSQAVVARDGSARMMQALEAEEVDFTVWKKLEVASVDAAMETVEMLADEYSGNCAVQSDSICRVELPLEYLDDFLKASSSIGEETYEENSEHKTETAVVLFQFFENVSEK